MKKTLNILKYLFFFGIGIFLFSLVYKEYDIRTFLTELNDLKWGWILFSLFLGVLSHISRAVRWNMLIKPLGFEPKTYNTFFSVMIMYATNLVIPRGGELARCTVLSRYEKIPFGKLVGTVVTERATDTLLLMILVFVTIFSQIGVFRQFIVENPEIGGAFEFLLNPWFWVLAFILGTGGLFILYKNRDRFRKIKIIDKVFQLLNNFFDGIKSIKQLEHPWFYIGHSIFIYIMYFLMMYVVFFSFEPTQNMTFIAGLTAFIMGGLAMLAPVQGGIGAWHFMVLNTLALYGLDKMHGKDFALISHTSMNLMLLVFGGLSFILLPLLNHNKNKQRSS